MSDLVQLFAIVGLLYLYECLQLVPLDAVVLQSPLPFVRYRLAPARFGLSRARGLVLAPPLPPLGTTLVVEPLPVALGDGGVTWPGAGGRHLAWAEVAGLEAHEAELRLGGARLGRMASEPAARALVAALREAAAAPDGEAREALLESWVARRMALAPVVAALRRYRRGALALRVAANALFLTVFVVVPLALFYGVGARWTWLAGAALGTWALTAIAFEEAARRCLDAGARPPAGKRATAMLSPLSAIRAHDALARVLLPDTDPLAVAAAVLSRGRFREEARRALAELLHGGIDPALDEVRRAEWTSHRARLRRGLWRLLDEVGLRDEELLAPPPREGPAAVAFCPRCRAQYVDEAAGCAACPDMTLLPLDHLPAARPTLPPLPPAPAPVVAPTTAQGSSPVLGKRSSEGRITAGRGPRKKRRRGGARRS